MWWCHDIFQIHVLLYLVHFPLFSPSLFLQQTLKETPHQTIIFSIILVVFLFNCLFIWNTITTFILSLIILHYPLYKSFIYPLLSTKPQSTIPNPIIISLSPISIIFLIFTFFLLHSSYIHQQNHPISHFSTFTSFHTLFHLVNSIPLNTIK